MKKILIAASLIGMVAAGVVLAGNDKDKDKKSCNSSEKKSCCSKKKDMNCGDKKENKSEEKKTEDKPQ